MLTSPTRTWTAGAVVLALLLTVAAWFLLISPERADAAALHQQTADTQARNDQLVARTAQLAQQFVGLPAKQAELAVVTAAMPQEAAVAELIRTLDRYAGETGVTLMNLAPGLPVAAPPPATAAPATDPATDPSVVAAPPVATGPVTVAVPVSMTVIGDFFAAKAFLQRLQDDMPRAYLVRGLSLTAEDPAEAGGGRPATVNGDVTLTITGDVFVLRDPAAVTTGTAAPVAPAVPATATAPVVPPGASTAPAN